MPDNSAISWQKPMLLVDTSKRRGVTQYFQSQNDNNTIWIIGFQNLLERLFLISPAKLHLSKVLKSEDNENINLTSVKPNFL